MAADPDPTLDFVRSLDDPSRWVVKRRTPLFKAHTLRIPETRLSDGRVVPARTNTVTFADLYAIADDMRRLEAGGNYGRITAGHVRMDPGVSEADQPDTLGFYRLHGVGPFGPTGELAVLVDEYLYPDRAAERNRHPYRSADYWHDRRRIFGMAVLTRPPALDLGVVSYRQWGPCYQYAIGGGEMPDAAMGPNNAAPPAATPSAGAQPAGDTYTPEEEAQYQRMCRYMRTTFQLDPNWPGAGNPTEPAPDDKNGNSVPDDKEKGPVTPMQAHAIPAQYQQQITAANAGRDAALAQLETERCKATLYGFQSEGFRLSQEQFDRELGKLAKLPAAERPDRVAELRAIYAGQQVPGGGLVQLQQHVAPVEGGSGDPDAAIYLDALALIRANPGMHADEAERRVREKRR